MPTTTIAPTIAIISSLIKFTYRSLLKESRKLPHLYLRSFFALKTRQYFRENILATKHCNAQLLISKTAKAQRELRKLQRANRGEKKALQHVLDLAYGRKGKLKHELMENYLTNPFETPPTRIIPAVERSRPPSYSPELATLLTSMHSRTLTRPLKPAALKIPPTLPERANPSSEEARILGPFSKRREVNIRWRYHTGEIQRTYYPLELTVPQGSSNDHNLRGTGLEKLGLLNEIEQLARSPIQGRPLPRRQKSSGAANVEIHTTEPCRNKFDSPLPPRFLRRRYRELLGRIPILCPDKTAPYRARTMWSPLALVSKERNVQYGSATEEDVNWIIDAENLEKGVNGK